MDSVNDSHDEQVTLLFEDARSRLSSINVEAKDKKKKIVIELAKELEGIYPMDTISIQIVRRLHGLASPSLIHECLDGKYKQKHRVDNAKKKKQRLQKELRLATPLVLNQEVKKKAVIVYGVDGRTSLHKNDDEPPYTTTDTSPKVKTFVKASSLSQQEKEQQLNNQSDPELIEGSDYKEVIIENQDLGEDYESSSHLVDAGKMVTVSPVPTYDNGVHTSNNILPFEFSKSCEELQKHMASLPERKDDSRVWFSGKIDKETGVVTSSSLGKIDQQQGYSIGFANRNE